MRNTILSISAFVLAAIAAGYTIATNPPEFLDQPGIIDQVERISEPARSTYSFGTKMSSGNFYARQTALSYSDCQAKLSEEARSALRTGLTLVCIPEDGDGPTFSLLIREVDPETSTVSDVVSVLFEGMTERDCFASRDEMNQTAVEHNPGFVDVFRCIPETGTEYYTTVAWRLVSEEGHISGPGTRSDCEANLAILEQARLDGSGSGLTYRCVEFP